MTDNSRVMFVTVAGAMLGGLAGYLLCTPQGRSLRRQLEASFEETAQELGKFRTTINKVAAVATEGWRLLDDFSAASRPFDTTHQSGPF